MRNLKAAIAAITGMVAVGASAQVARADAIIGSNSISYGGTSLIGGHDLISASGVTFTRNGAWGFDQSGEFTTIDPGLALTSSSIIFSNLGSYSFTSSAGSFQAVSSMTVGSSTMTSELYAAAVDLQSGVVTSESLSFYFIGNFIPNQAYVDNEGGSFSGLTANVTSETVTVDENFASNGNVSFSSSGTVISPAQADPGPPVPVPSLPEPSSVLIFGTGLAALGLCGLPRRRSTRV